MNFATRLMRAVLTATGAMLLMGAMGDLAVAQSTPFQQTKSKNCAGISCVLSFPMPSGERRDAISVSCLVIMKADGRVGQASLMAYNQADTKLATHTLVPVYTGLQGSSTWAQTAINNQLLAFVPPAGGKFEVWILGNTEATTTMSMTCTISGQRVKP